MKRQTRLLFDTILLGIVGALGAQLFTFLLSICNSFFMETIAGYHAPGLATDGETLIQTIGPHWLWFVPLVLVIGGLISGFLVYQFAPEAEGHGTDSAVKSFHKNNGVIRNRVAPLKIIASAITIGSGGAAGREGPTALFSAGFGSIYAKLTHRTDNEKRLLVLIGMAAGLSAIFRSPIGTAIFAIEVLYSDMEFEGEALVYTMLGSIIAYALNAVFSGWGPLFQIPASIKVESFSDYGWYILLGLSSGIIGAILPEVFYKIRDGFKKIPIKPHFKPAIGAFLVGLIALAFPQVLGGGYGWIQLAINGKLALNILLILIFGKIIAFSFTVSSGGSGGVFAPALFVGAMLGGAFANIFHQPSAAFVVVGMAAVFGSTARVPIATLLMVTEMTGGYHLLVPAALAVMLGYLLQRWITSTFNFKYISLYEAQVKDRTVSPAHRVEHLKTAVKVLSERKSYNSAQIGKLDFVGLLTSGIPLQLPDKKVLYLGTLNRKSNCIGKKIKDNCLFDNDNESEIVSVFREEHLIVPDDDFRFEKEDQVLILTKPEKLQSLKNHFTSKSRRRLRFLLKKTK